MNNRKLWLMSLGLLGLTAFSAAGKPGSGDQQMITPAQAQKKLNAKAHRFIQNAGQWDGRAKFMARSQNVDVWITSKGVTYDHYRSGLVKGELGREGDVVQMNFLGAANPKTMGQNSARMSTSYIAAGGQGSISAESYHEVLQKSVYRGIDVRSYFDHQQPRYDFVVAPGADASQIKLGFKGTAGVAVRNGEIVLKTSVGELKQGKLLAYQSVDGKRVRVPASFRKVGATSVAFSLGSYDHSKQLVIDPLIYGTYYGGDGGFDEVHAVTTDTSGGVYMTGYTKSSKFPAIAGPYGFARFGGRDAFITKLQGDAYNHDYAAIFGGSSDDVGMQIDVDPFGDIWIAGMTNSSNFPGGNLMFLKNTSGTNPTSGTFTITYPGIGTTVALPYNATPGQVKQALVSLLGITNVRVTNQSSIGSRLNQGGIYKIILPSDFNQTLTVDSSGLSPGGTYAVPARTPFIFLMRWRQSQTQILTPFPQVMQYFGGETPLTLNSFRIVPNSNPAATDAVKLTFAGSQGGNATNSDIPSSPVGGTENGYMARYEFDTASRTFLRIDALTKFVSSNGAADVDLSGMAVDRFGSVYVGGSVFFQGNVDTALNPVFETTNGVFENGRLLRNGDLFVRKYSESGSLIYSALIGGNADDFAGGNISDQTWASSPGGSTIAVDDALNLYITGVSGSFNFPRTLGVYGEVFGDNNVVIVTKIDAAASEIKYSTNLRTSGWVEPSGIAVDTKGDAFVTGIVHANWQDFPDASGGNFDPTKAADPNEPNAQSFASIQTTADALDPTYTSPVAPQLVSDEGFINVLNSTATTLVYGSYMGGDLDEVLYAPYVDKFGDVWMFGSVDTFRIYARLSSANPPVQTIRSVSASLPATLITNLAFKRFPDSETGNAEKVPGVIFGLWGQGTGPFTYIPISWSPGAAPKPAPLQIPTLADNRSGSSAFYLRDGFVIKQRIGFAAIGSLTLNPPTAPGGLGEQITGTVTLTDPAPIGGADIQLELNNGTAASFSSTGSVTTETITIAGGATTGTFTIYTQPVTSNTNVQVKATYQGSFKISQFVVIPWLQDLALTPTSVVGGNTATGRITLAKPAPAGGVEVTLGTDTPSLISFPSGSTITVPAGQTVASFTIDTQGVADTTFASVRASLLGLGINRTLTLTQASLSKLVFSPARVAGGTTTVGTIFLDGKAGSPFTLNLTIDSGTGGYQFPKTITVPTGASSVSFDLKTAFESSNTSRTITVTRPAQGTYTKQTISATIFVDAVFLTGFNLTPNTIDGGAKAVGTVTISNPAPAGGVVVNLKSSNNSVATVPSQVIVEAGESTASFDIMGQTIAIDKTVTITATRGTNSFSDQLTVKGVTFTLDLNPTSVVGGRDDATGTIVLSSPAPASGVTVNLKSNASFALVPPTVTIAAGQTTGTFTIATSTVNTTKNATITATLGTNVVSATLEVRAIGVDTVTFTPARLRGGNTTLLTVTLEGAAPAGGATVTLSASDPSLFTFLPSSITIDPGQTSRTITLTTRRVSRTLATTVTATYNGSAASATLIVDR